MFGVDLFFALSGFLIGGILFRCVPEDGVWSMAGMTNFWKRRWWRTLPNYFLFLLISIGFHYPRGELNAGDHLPAFFVFSQYLFQTNGDFFGVSWSLCVEEWFYLLFPLVLAGCLRVTRSRGAAFALAGLFFVVVGVGCRFWAMGQVSPVESRFMTLPRLDAIFYGVALAVVTQSFTLSPRIRISMAAAGAALVAVVLHRMSGAGSVGSAGFLHFSTVALPLGFSLMMPLLAIWKRMPEPLSLLSNPVTAVSQWSYSIYLCHYPIIMGIYPWFGLSRDLPVVNLLSKVAGVAFTLLVARTVFRYVESPFTAMRPAEIGSAREWAAHSSPPSVGIAENREKTQAVAPIL